MFETARGKLLENIPVTVELECALMSFFRINFNF